MCERCGHGSARLEVHHLTYDRFKKERLDDLLVVCKPCHEKEEIKRKAELEKKAKKALYNARFEGYMKAKHGEDYLFYEEPTDEDYEEFDQWLEKKQENDLGELL